MVAWCKMGRRKLRDIYKQQIISVKKKTKKEQLEKGKPTFKNLEIDYDRVNDKDINIVVSDVLSDIKKCYGSLVLSAKKTGSTFIVTSIRCPICNKPVELNQYWMCFICQCPEHAKMNFEIIKVL